MHHTLKINLYPNNEIRSVIYRTPNRSSDCSPDHIGVDENGGDFDSGSEIKSADCAPGVSVSNLDISSKLSPGYGGIPRKTRFGLNARRVLARCAGVFEADGIPNEESIFLTGTIPGGTKEAFDAVAKWSSWIVKSVKTWISNAGVEDNYSMYCWEFQKRGALHLHYLLTVKDEKYRLFVMWKWAIKWSQLIDSVGKKEGVDMWKKADGSTWANRKSVLQAPAQYVKKSVGAYLAKYLSKQAPSPGNNIEGECLNPVRWWGCSRPLLARMKELSAELVVEWIPLNRYRSLWEKVVGGFASLGSGFHEFSDKLGYARVVVGYDEDAGQLYNQFWRDLCNRNRSIVANSLQVWRHLPGSAETPTSGKTLPPCLALSTPESAASTPESRCSSLTSGLVQLQFKPL
jgi:hypothetical protein